MLHISYRTNHPDNFNDSGIFKELLSSPSCAKNYILAVGPGVANQKASSGNGHTHKYLGPLLEAVVHWCIHENIIQQQDIIDNLRVLLDKGAIIPAGYQIEEHLTTRQQKQECLRTVLHNHNQVQAIHYQLASFPFRGYITTCYDTCIETAYADSQHSQLSKFYQSSLTQAIDASRKRQPFILKLYGDLDDPDSINLGHRLLTGLYATDMREQLHQLLSETPTIFIGFEQTDEDLIALQSLTKNRYIVHQNHSNGMTEQIKCANSGEINSYVESGFQLSSPGRVFSAVHALSSDTKAIGKKVPYHASADIDPDSENPLQQRNKKVVDVVIFYAPEDKRYKDGIAKVLNSLKNKENKFYEIKYITLSINESPKFISDRKDSLMSAQIVILLISLSFLGSDYYNKEYMREVVRRYKDGAWIIPILVSTCDWEGRQFDDLKEYILPRDKVPISDYKPQSKAYLDISKDLEYAIGTLAGRLIN